MSRNAHVWFLAGIILSFLTIMTIWLSAVILGQVWASQWGILIPLTDVVIFAAALWAWRRRWKRFRRAEPHSRELRSRWFIRYSPAPCAVRRI